MDNVEYIQVYSPLKKLNDALENDHYTKNPFLNGRTRCNNVQSCHSDKKTSESTTDDMQLSKSKSLVVYPQCQKTLHTENDQSFLFVRLQLENSLIQAKSLEEIKIWGDDFFEQKEEIKINHTESKPAYKAENVKVLKHTKSMYQPSSAITMKLLSKLSEETKMQLTLISDIKPISKAIYMMKQTSIKRPIKATEKTIIFDMDDTLTYTFSLLPSKIKNLKDNIRTITLNKISISFAIRPYLYEMLAILQPYFEIIVFTASQKEYADEILNTIDPSNKWFNFRLYRNNCIANQNMLVKDLRILQRDLKKVVIVDNSILSFSAQIDNGIPVKSYNGDNYDRELMNLTDYLMKLRNVDDVREVNKEAFHLSDLIFYCKSFKDR